MRTTVLLAFLAICILATTLEAKSFDIKNLIAQKVLQKKAVQQNSLHSKKFIHEHLENVLHNHMKRENGLNKDDKTEDLLQKLKQRLISKRRGRDDNKVDNKGGDRKGPKGGKSSDSYEEEDEMEHMYAMMFASPYFSNAITRDDVETFGAEFLGLVEKVAEIIQNTQNQLDALDADGISPDTVGPIMETYMINMETIGNNSFPILGDVVALMFRYFLYGTESAPRCEDIGFGYWGMLMCTSIMAGVFEEFVSDPTHPQWEIPFDHCNNLKQALRDENAEFADILQAIRDDLDCIAEKLTEALAVEFLLESTVPETNNFDLDVNDTIAEAFELLTYWFIDLSHDIESLMGGLERVGGSESEESGPEDDTESEGDVGTASKRSFQKTRDLLALLTKARDLKKRLVRN